jgi:Domain of unknown function (DUF2760)
MQPLVLMRFGGPFGGRMHLECACQFHLAESSGPAMVLAMERNTSTEKQSFSARLSMALRLLFNGAFAQQVAAGLKALAARETKPAELKTPALPPERAEASGLFVLSALQREGRLIDFLQQEVTGFSDEDVGAAARVIHAGCSKVLKQYFDIEPAVGAAEGSSMTVPPGFDAQRIRLTGNVTGQPPFKGALKHHGWIAKGVRLPAMTPGLDPRVVAAAEVELA